MAARFIGDWSTDLGAAEVPSRSVICAAEAPSYFAGKQAIWLAASNDAREPKSNGPLWQDDNIPDLLADSWAALKEQWAEDDADWSFWIKWYEGILNGTPMPWELTHRIALEVTEKEWEAGQTVVAARIAEIRARYDLEQSAREVEAQLSAFVPAASLPPRGHNNPPELIDEPSLLNEIAALRLAVTTLKEQAESASPQKAEVEQALSTIVNWRNAVIKWLGRKAELIVDTTIKWGIPTVGGYLMLNPNQLEVLIDAAKTFLPLLN